MDTAAVIPVRMGSTRYPGKPLCDIQGMSMVEHVWRRTVPASNVDATYIATPDEEIRQAAESFGADVIMTGEHDRATDRVAEAARTFEADVVVVMQGDEPLIHPEMIEQAVQPVVEGVARVTNLAKPIRQQEQYTDPNNVKLVVNRDSEALYFSRAPIPNLHTGSYEETRVLQQVCVIPFERSLVRFSPRVVQKCLEVLPKNERRPARITPRKRAYPGFKYQFADGLPVVLTEIQRHFTLDILPGDRCRIFEQLDRTRRDIDPMCRLGVPTETARFLGASGVHTNCRYNATLGVLSPAVRAGERA